MLLTNKQKLQTFTGCSFSNLRVWSFSVNIFVCLDLWSDKTRHSLHFLNLDAWNNLQDKMINKDWKRKKCSCCMWFTVGLHLRGKKRRHHYITVLSSLTGWSLKYESKSKLFLLFKHHWHRNSFSYLNNSQLKLTRAAETDHIPRRQICCMNRVKEKRFPKPLIGIVLDSVSFLQCV